MREILFRGKCDGEWVYGSLHIENGETDQHGNSSLDYRILGMRGECHYVIPETVGQYTGMKDKNGTKIFEGDIVKSTDRFNKSVGYFVEFKDGAFMLKQQGVNYHIYFNDLPEKHYCVEVIGNIHDNK